MTWTPAYIYGDYGHLLGWLIATFPATEEGADKPYQVPPTMAFRGPYLLPRELTGKTIDDEGNEYPVYQAIDGRADILCLVSVTDISLLEIPDVTVHVGLTIDEIKELYPAHALGQPIPHIAVIK